MMTLLTGTPGTGKTAWMVAWLLRKMPKEPRPLFVHGVSGLKIPHETLVCDSPFCEPCGKLVDRDAYPRAENWPDWCPDGALLVVDEVQYVWKPRASGSASPEAVAKLATHRHRGIDMLLLSQAPGLVDVNVRRQIGKHIHLESKWAGRIEYEWPHCCDDLSTTKAIRRPYRLPHAVFGLYKSAEVHTKLEHRKPLGLYVLGVAGVLVAVLAYRVASRVSEFTAGGEAVKATATAALAAGADASTASSPTDMWTPAVKGRYETAPAYSGLLQVVDVPLPVACVALKDRCVCYTDQATPYPMPDNLCREYVNGRVFNPYWKPSDPVSAPVSQPIDKPAGDRHT